MNHYFGTNGYGLFLNMQEYEDFKAKFGKYLPGNFSYVDHIAWLNAAQYC